MKNFNFVLPTVLSHIISNVYNISGIRNLTHWWVNLCSLNEHRFLHSFDTVLTAELRPHCACGTGNWDNRHFLLHCPLYILMHSDLLSQLADVRRLNIASMNAKDLCKLLLCGTLDWNLVANRVIIEAATMSFIEQSKRFGSWTCLSKRLYSDMLLRRMLDFEHSRN